MLDIERGQLDTKRQLFWQTDTSIDKRSWGYIGNPDYKTAEQIVGDLIDIVRKNGALLLNIGPRPDGTIPEEQERILLEIGRWLETNGEAIYGTRPWKIYGEGPTKVVGGSFKDTARQAFTKEDIRFTTKDNALYAIALAWPGDQRITIRGLAGDERKIRNVTLLGSKARLKWTHSPEGLQIETPAQKPGEFAFTFKIE